MIKKITTIIFLFILIFTSSCSSLNKFNAPKNFSSFSDTNFVRLNAYYSVYPVDSSLPYFSFLINQFNYELPNTINSIKIETKGDTVLILSSIKDGEVTKFKTINGTISQGCFLTEKIVHRDFNSFLINRIVFSQSRIYLLDNGDLMLDYFYELTGFFLFLPIVGREVEKYQVKFSKIK